MKNDNPSKHIPEGVELKFDNKYVQPILKGEKTITLRVGIDSNDFPEGAPILLCDEDGDWFAEAGVVNRDHTTVRKAAEMEFDGHQNYSDVDELLKTLRGYYPDRDIRADTRLEIIEWGELW